MYKPRRVRIRTSKHYAVFRLDSEVTIAELNQSTRSTVPPPRTHLLALAMQSAHRAAARAAATEAATEAAEERVA